MALPSSGTLSISQIASEFSDTAPHSMSEFYRGGGLVPDSPSNTAVPTSGQIAIGNFYGAQNRVGLPLTITGNTQNYNLYTTASANPVYSAGSTDITLTINPGVYVGSTSTGSYALSIPGSFNPGDTVTVVNNGTVIGMAGNGGSGGPGGFPGIGSAGSNAGNAVYVNFPTIITNNGTLAGGGGGGGGGRGWEYVAPPQPKQPSQITPLGGGGGGGGAGYNAGSGGAGGPATSGNQTPYPGSPGSSGSFTSGGNGGAGGSFPNGSGGPGGSGGGQGANGSSGGSTPFGPGSGGGTRGFYLVGNPYVTYPATGTRLGQVS